MSVENPQLLLFVLVIWANGGHLFMQMVQRGDSSILYHIGEIVAFHIALGRFQYFVSNFWGDFRILYHIGEISVFHITLGRFQYFISHSLPE